MCHWLCQCLDNLLRVDTGRASGTRLPTSKLKLVATLGERIVIPYEFFVARIASSLTIASAHAPGPLLLRASKSRSADSTSRLTTARSHNTMFRRSARSLTQTCKDHCYDNPHWPHCPVNGDLAELRIRTQMIE